MAKLVLTIQPKDEGALKSVQALKAEVQSLSKSLSSIKITSSGVETTRKGYANLITTLKTLKSQYADGVFGNLPQDAERAFKKIQEISAAFQESGKLTKEQAKAYAQLSQQLKKYTADLATVKAKNDKIVAANPFTVTQAQQIPRLIKQYSTLLTTLRNTEKYYPKGTFDTFKADLTQGQQELQALNNEFLTTGTLSQDSQVKLNNLANGYNQLNASIAQTASTMKSSKGGLLDIISGFAKFQLSAMLVMKPLQMIRSALASINETLVKTEDAVIALQRVLPTGSATDDEISSRLYKVAQDYGQTFENVSEIATNFARSGMSWADTIKATEAAVLALNVAELDAEEATNGLIAILSQFGLTASDLETVIDELNKTADNFPVTTQKILAALQRTGSAASNANLSLEQTIALITALSKATGRSGENIGTALNSLIQYSSKASALNTFAALSEASEEVVEKFRQGGATILDVWRQVSAEIKNLKADQADLLDQYFSTEDGEALKEALDGELEDIYTELGGVYDTANTFRKNYFIALLGNMDTVEQAMGTLDGAAGYSQKENEKYLDTYTAKLNSLKAQWQDVANDEQGILGIKKDLVDLGSGVLKVVQAMGGLKTALLAIGVVITTIIATVKGAQVVEGLKLVISTLRTFTIDAIPNAIAAIKAYRAGITTLGTTIQAALPLLTLIVIAISALDSAFRQHAEERAEVERQALEAQNEAIAKSNERVDAQKKEVQSMEEVAASVEELRNILDDSTASEEEKRSAQEQLLQIQNTLIDSNNAYKDSLDLTNGSLKEQLGLIEQLTTEQLKQRAQEWLNSTQSEREIAQSRLESQSTTNTDMVFNGTANDRFRFRDIIDKAIKDSGLDDVADIIEDNVYGMFHKYYKEIFESDGFWEGVGNLFNPFDDLFTAEGWTGSASAGFSFSGTIEEQIDAIEKLRDYISTHREELGLSAEEVVSITTELGKQLEVLNSEDYQQAKLLAERAKATQDFLDGTITEAEYLEKVYGIQKEINEELKAAENTIESLTKDNLQSLIDALKAMREEQEASLELEKQKQKVIDAQNALLAAQQILEKANNGTLTLGDLGEADLQALLNVINDIRDSEKLALDIEEKKKDLLEAQNVLAEKQAELTRTQNALRLAQMGIATDLGNYSESALKALADGISDLISAEKLALEIEEKKREIIDAQNELVEKQNALTKAQNALVAAQRGTIADISDLTENALDALIDGLKRLRDEEEDSVELEEKKLAVLEAQRALENVKNERSLRRFNSETGQYEWQVDEKKVADAEETLQSAIEALNEYIENQAWDDVIAELESGNATNDSIKSILDKWLSEGLSQETYDRILSGIYDLQKSQPVIDALNADFEALQADYDEALQNLNDLRDSFNEYLEQKAWEEVKDAIASGNVDDAQIRAILDKWSAEGLPEETYNKIASSIESLKLSQPVIDALNADFEAAQKSYTEANEKVQSAIEALQSYLEEKAWTEIKEAIASGNVDDAALREILDKWRDLGLPQDSYNQIQDTIQKAIGSDAFKGSLQETVNQLSQSYNDTLSEYEKWLEDKVWKNVMDELESGKATNDSIKALLDKWKSESYQNGLPSWYQGIIEAIEKYSGVDLSNKAPEGGSNATTPQKSEPKTEEDYYNALKEAGYFSSRGISEGAFRNGLGRQYSSDEYGRLSYLKELYSHWTATPKTIQDYYDELQYWGMSQNELSNLQRNLANPSLTEEYKISRLKQALSELTGRTYDKGGAAFGKGLMRKATDKAETINDPELTAKILSPVSNEEFHRWVRDQGILFETARRYAQSPVIERVGGATDNRVDNSGQVIINGIKIGSDMMNKPLVEVLRHIKFMM